MQTSTILVLELGAIGAVLCGFVGMTLWKDKGGSPSSGLVVGMLFGTLGLFFLAIGKPGQKEIDRVARSRGRLSEAANFQHSLETSNKGGT